MPDQDFIFEDEALQSGFTQVWNCILEDASLSVQSRLLYTVFCRFGWTGACHPGQERLGEILGVKPRRVRDYIHELCEAGLITARQRGFGKTNVYIIHAPVITRKPVINDRSGRAVTDDRSERSHTTGLTRAGVGGLENTHIGEYGENFQKNPENRSHEEQDHHHEGDTEDSLLNPASSMDGIGESNPSEPPPQTATEKPFDQDTNEISQTTDLPENHRPARSDPKGGGHLSDQARRREERKAGKKPWEIEASSRSVVQAEVGVPLTKKQAKKAWAKKEAEKWLARHTSTSSS